MKGRVAFIPTAHKIEFHEYDVPAPAAGGLVAAVTQTNVCGSEVHMWKGEFGRRGVMPGHEMSGRIEALGAGVRADWAGAGKGRRSNRSGLLHGVQSMRELRQRQSCGVHRQGGRRAASR
jgi:D-arabinose 1-dehydrogenase-like Zn-dependent alcohol dehydrogenase